MSKEKIVKFDDTFKRVNVNKYAIKKIKINHSGLSTELVANEGEEIYQAIKSQTLFVHGGKTTTTIIGRVVGKIKDGEVIEERIIDNRYNEIYGFKK